MTAIEYHHGDMDIEEQRKTFRGFMRLTVWGSALVALTLVFLTLHFTFIGLGWFPSLAITFVLGVVIGLGLGMKTAWYATIVALGIFMGLVGLIVAGVNAALG